MGNFKKLRVWNDAIDLATIIYQYTSVKPFMNDYGLSSQIQRAAVSIASNIAEGNDREHLKDQIRFFNMAQASAAEVITQLNIAYRIGYITQTDYQTTEDFSQKIRASIKNLIKTKKAQL